MRYATKRARVYTITIINILVPTIFQYNEVSHHLFSVFHSVFLIVPSIFSQITYKPKSAKADQIAKYFKIVE